MWFPALRFALQSRSHAVRLRLAATPARVRAVGTNGVCRRGGRERARCRGGHVLPCGCKVRRVPKTQACDGSRPAGAGVDTGRGPLRSTVQATPHSPAPGVGFLQCSLHSRCAGSRGGRLPLLAAPPHPGGALHPHLSVPTEHECPLPLLPLPLPSVPGASAGRCPLQTCVQWALCRMLGRRTQRSHSGDDADRASRVWPPQGLCQGGV